MSWFFIALVPPALFAVSNYLDKYLLSTYFKDQGSGALIIFSSLVGLIAIPFILIFQRSVFDLTLSTEIFMAASGALYIIALLPYFASLRDDDASVVVPLWQLIPVFGYIFGYFILGETMSLGQIGAGVLVLAGGFLLSLDFQATKFSVKWRLLLLMALASILMALNSVAFKYFALDASYWVTSFWSYVGLVAVGIGFLVFSKTSRMQFVAVFKVNSLQALGINTINEIVNVVGMFILNFALLLAPVAYIFLAGSVQPLFVLIYGVVLTLLFPKYIEENIERSVLIQKVIAITLMVAGAFLMDYVSHI
jgi:uncharacterized membrane protein